MAFQSDSSRLTRRRFLASSSKAMAVGAALPAIIPATAWGMGQRPAPSDRITLGCIGTGGMGTHNLGVFLAQPDVQVLAVADVETESNLYYGGTYGREPAKAMVEKFYAEQSPKGGSVQCASYRDFRELLARDDIDAVVVCTPDHWHALVSVAAADAGKDIYCEKPLANSIGEGRAICQAVRRNQRVLQTGSHERSGDNARFACELVRNGRIGKLHTIRVNLPGGEPHHQRVQAVKSVPPSQPVPEGFDYDMWLGHTPKVDYTPDRCHFWWRFILAYGGGEMTDRGAHVIDLAQLGAGTDDTGPVEIQANGTASPTSLYDAFFDFQFENRYANGVRMIGTSQEPRGVKFEGSDGWIFIHVHGGALEAEPADLLKQDGAPTGPVSLGRSPGHHRNFLDCVKSRQQPVAHAEIGHRTATICHLNNIAMRLGRTLKWDPQQERFLDDEEANGFITPTMRAPWTLAAITRDR